MLSYEERAGLRRLIDERRRVTVAREDLDGETPDLAETLTQRVRTLDPGAGAPVMRKRAPQPNDLDTLLRIVHLLRALPAPRREAILASFRPELLALSRPEPEPKPQTQVVRAVADAKACQQAAAVRLADAAVRYRLRPREVEVLALIADGYRDGEIAQRLCVSEGTVKTHVKRLLAQMHARNRSHAVALALEGSPEVGMAGESDEA